MPTGTFFRLPEEKRSRLMEVAWEEFSNTPYAKGSINRIIQAAQIPRGSFYQYFADKEELFLYMVESLQNSLKEKLTQCLEQGEGDLFQLPMRLMDWAEGGEGELDPQVRRFARIVGMNQGTDVFQLVPRSERLLPEDVMARVNTAQLPGISGGYLLFYGLCHGLYPDGDPAHAGAGGCAAGAAAAANRAAASGLRQAR